MYFASKKDSWFLLLIWGFILFIFLMHMFGSEPVGLQLIAYNSLLGSVISGVLVGLLLWIWFKTGYKIESGKINIQFGPFKKTIKIESIKKIHQVKHPFTAPALSIDRVEILYNKYEIITISPQNKNEFIRLLLLENPSIQIDE